MGGVPLLAVTFLGIAGLCAIGYMRTEEQDPGLTTETALLLTVLLGGFALKEPVNASALAVTAGLGYGFDSYAVNIYGLVLPEIKKTLEITEAQAGYIGSIEGGCTRSTMLDFA